MKKSEIADIDLAANRSLFTKNNISPGGAAIKSVEANRANRGVTGSSFKGIIATDALKSTKPAKIGYSDPYINVVDDDFDAPDIGVSVKKLASEAD